MNKRPNCFNIYDTKGTRYQNIAIFYVYTEFSHRIFEKLLHTNRISLSYENYKMKKDYTTKQDTIYIKALYFYPNSVIEDVKLLVSNDARRKICSLYKKRIENTNFVFNIEQRLRLVLAEHYPAIRTILNNIHCLTFTAGSFPLQVFLNEVWAGSDLDIFVSNFLRDDYKLLRSNLESISSNIKPLYNKSKTTMETDAKATVDISYSDNNNIKNVWEYTLYNGFRIQIIETHCYTIERIVERFDLDFCKIAFDFYLSELIISPNCRKAIESKTSKYHIKKTMKHNYERIHKYEKRGFTIL